MIVDNTLEFLEDFTATGYDNENLLDNFLEFDFDFSEDDFGFLEETAPSATNSKFTFSKQHNTLFCVTYALLYRMYYSWKKENDWHKYCLRKSCRVHQRLLFVAIN